MAISGADVNLLRGGNHRIELLLNAVPLVTVATAQINQSAFSYPLAQVTVDNTSAGWSNVRVGMAFTIGTTAGARDVTWGVVRLAPNSNTFYFDAKSLGDSGFARNIRGGLADNTYITIYRHRPLWGELSAIRNSTFYKRFDVAYTDDGSNPSPVTVIGRHRAAYVNAGTNLAQFAFSAANSYAWGAKTITGYSWNIDGGTLVSGTLTSSSITVNFSPGFYVVECTVTDSGGKTQTAHRYVFANARSGNNAPFGVLNPWTIDGDRQDAKGRSLTVTTYGDFTEAEIYPGQPWILTETATYNGSQISNADHTVWSYVGYLSERSITRTRSTPSIELTFKSPLELARDIPAVSQQITEVTTPNDWSECTSALSHPPGAVWYILKHHAPNFLAAHDYVHASALRNLRKQSFVMQADSISGQIDQVQELALGNVGCRSDGSIVFVPNPMYYGNTDRNALENRFTWSEGDIAGQLQYPFRYTPPVGQIRGYAFSFGGGAEATPYASLAPGKAQAQGTGRGEITFIVSQSDGQTRVNEVTGHHYALEAAPTPTFSVVADRNLDIAEPADVNVWHTLNIPTAYDPIGEGWVNRRVIPTQVSRAWRKQDGGGTTKQITVEWKPETFGQPGVTIPVERSGANSWLYEGFNFQIPVDFDPKFDDNFALAWNDSALGRTLSFTTSNPHWESITGGILGTLNDVALDYASEYFFTGVGMLGAWVVTTSGTTLRVYYAVDIRTSTPSWSLQASFTMADSTVTNAARIVSDKSTPFFAVLAWKDGTGTRIARTTDGTTWGSATRVGSSITDVSDNNNRSIGLLVENGYQLVTAPDAAGDYYLYRATTAGGAFSQLSGSATSDRPYPLIIPDGLGNAYTREYGSSGGSGGAAINVTFDPGGTSYDYIPSIIGTGDGTFSIAAGYSGSGGQFSLVCSNYTYAELMIRASFGVQSTFTGGSFRYRIQYVSGGWSSVVASIAPNGVPTQTWSATADNTWRQVSTSNNVSGVTEVEFRIAFTNISGPVNVVITFDDCTATQAATVYRINSYQSTPVWTVITPPTGYEPSYPYALAVDPLSPGRVMMVAENVSQRRLTTVDQGGTWVDSGVTPETWRGLKVANQQVVGFGVGAIRHSTDAGASFSSKIGDWANTIGAVGAIRGVWCIL